MAVPQDDARLQELEETITILSKRLSTWKTLYKELNDDFTLLAMSVIEAQQRDGLRR